MLITLKKVPVLVAVIETQVDKLVRVRDGDHIQPGPK